MTRFGLPQASIDRINAVLASHPEVERATLYGSRAKGTFKPGSDIDLALEGDLLTHDLLLRIMTDLDDLLLPWMTDLLILPELDHQPLREHIARVGKTFYERADVTGKAGLVE
jgi:predicted nucleotidyltransferase